MCTHRACLSCKSSYTAQCTDSNASQDHKVPAQTAQSKCSTCTTIEGVIAELRVLIIRYPFLETEGRGHLDTMAEWEYGADLVKPTPTEEYTATMRQEDNDLRVRLKEMGLEEMTGTENVWEGEGFGQTPKDKKSGSQGSEETWCSHDTSSMLVEADAYGKTGACNPTHRAMSM